MLFAKADSMAGTSYTLRLLRDDAHGDVSCPGRVRERTYADEVGSSFGDGADIFKHDAAGCFDGDPAILLANAIDGCFDLLRSHVVQEDRFGSHLESIVKVLHRPYFDLNAISGLALF